MMLIIESIILCMLFTLFVYIISNKPIKTLYNYPPKIQQRVKSLDQYKDKIPTHKNKIFAKLSASLIIIVLLSLLLHYVNNCSTFSEAFLQGFILWSIVNIYDVFIIDICWFCHSKKFIFEGTEDMTNEYHNYLYHIKQGFVGELIGFIVCIVVGIIIQYII